MLGIFWVIVLVLLLLQLILLVGLTVMKINALKREKETEDAIDNFKPKFLQYVNSKNTEEPDFTAVKQLDFNVVETILDELSDEKMGKAEKEKLFGLAEKHLAAHYQCVLKKGRWAERVNALYFIEDFQIFSLRDDVYRHFTKLDSQDEEFRQNLRTCTALQEARVMETILENKTLSAVLIKELLMRLNNELLDIALKQLETNENVSENAIFAFIAFSGEQKNDVFFPFVEKKLADERKEVRLKAMGSICGYGKISNPSVLSSFFISSDWEERMYAAKVAGACKLEQFKQPVLDLLADSVWWVRYAGAENITAFADGESLLRHIAKSHEDAYAKDIAKHMLTTRGGES